MKKILSLILALVMVFGLVACGGEPEVKETEAPPAVEETEAPAVEETEAPAEEVTFLPGGGSNIAYVITPATSNVFFATDRKSVV